MDKKLYHITVNKTCYYYVRCTAVELTGWLIMLEKACLDAKVTTVEINLSNFDEINHNHFC